MNFDTALSIAFLVGAVISFIGYRWTSANVCLTYHDQKVGAKK